MGEAVYLLGYLIGRVEWKTGQCKVTYEAIAAKTGFPSRTISRWMQVLEGAGEISTRRIPNGTLVTILDYEPVAKTRRVDYKPPRQHATHGMSEPPAMAEQHAVDGMSDMPPTADQHATGGISNIREIPKEVQRESTPKSDSLLSVEEILGPPFRRTKPQDDLYDYADPLDREADDTRELMAGLPEDAREALVRQAMEELHDSPKPWLRRMVRQNEQGDLEPAVPGADKFILQRAGRALARESDRAAA